MNAVSLEGATSTQPSFEQVCDFLRSSQYPHLAAFVASVDGSEVVLRGESASFHSKQLAQNVAARCPGVSRVRNLIRVKYPR